MLAVITAALDLLTLILKSIFRSCSKRKNEKLQRTTKTNKNTDKTKGMETKQRSSSKKHRRASVTERKVQTSEITTIYELSGSSGGSSSPNTQEITKI